MSPRTTRGHQIAPAFKLFGVLATVCCLMIPSSIAPLLHIRLDLEESAWGVQYCYCIDGCERTTGVKERNFCRSNHVYRRLAYKTIVLPVLTYGAALWYTGVRQKGLTKQMAKVQNAGLRLILGTFRTSPAAALHHIGSILPVPLLLERTLDNAAIRLRTLPRHAQPIVRLAEPWNHGPVQGPTHSKSRTKKLTNLQQLATRAHFTLNIDERTNPYATPPWQLGNIWGSDPQHSRM
ncbi:hypothetical protein AB1N83_009626 [Pleurotus pulmonarius]